MARSLDAELVELDFPKLGRVHRYFKSIFQSMRRLRSKKPDVLFVQNPSLLLALFGYFYGRMTKVVVIVDAHNAGIEPAEGQSIFLQKIANFVVRNSKLTIVTNDYLAARVKALGGDAIAVPDPLPELNASEVRRPATQALSVFFVCTWADDEPYIEVIEAARLLTGKVSFRFSGRLKESLRLPEIPENVELCGYLSDEDFVNEMASADVVVDLTNREHCLVCGAYEATSLGRPMLLSDTEALRGHFSEGCAYTDNSVADIAAKLEGMKQNLDDYEQGVLRLKTHLLRDWDRTRLSVDIRVNELVEQSK